MNSAINNNRKCAVVDAYGSASIYPVLLNELGYDCIHVQSMKNLTLNFSRTFNKDQFFKNFIYDDNLSVICEELKQEEIDFIMPGIEPGVLLADHISHRLGLKSSDYSKSPARRNKYLMGELLRQEGLHHIKQLKTNNLDEVIGWVNKNI